MADEITHAPQHRGRKLGAAGCGLLLVLSCELAAAALSAFALYPGAVIQSLSKPQFEHSCLDYHRMYQLGYSADNRTGVRCYWSVFSDAMISSSDQPRQIYYWYSDRVIKITLGPLTLSFYAVFNPRKVPHPESLFPIMYGIDILLNTAH